MTGGPGAFSRIFFRGPPPGPALAFCSERLASTPGGREHGIGVVVAVAGRHPCPMLRLPGCGVRTQVARATSHGRGLCITNGKARGQRPAAAWCVLFLEGAGSLGGTARQVSKLAGQARGGKRRLWE
jgi:hypothetical protein